MASKRKSTKRGAATMARPASRSRARAPAPKPRGPLSAKAMREVAELVKTDRFRREVAKLAGKPAPKTKAAPKAKRTTRARPVVLPSPRSELVKRTKAKTKAAPRPKARAIEPPKLVVKPPPPPRKRQLFRKDKAGRTIDAKTGKRVSAERVERAKRAQAAWHAKAKAKHAQLAEAAELVRKSAPKRVTARKRKSADGSRGVTTYRVKVGREWWNAPGSAQAIAESLVAMAKERHGEDARGPGAYKRKHAFATIVGNLWAEDEDTGKWTKTVDGASVGTHAFASLDRVGAELAGRIEALQAKNPDGELRNTPAGPLDFPGTGEHSDAGVMRFAEYVELTVVELEDEEDEEEEDEEHHQGVLPGVTEAQAAVGNRGKGK